MRHALPLLARPRDLLGRAQQFYRDRQYAECIAACRAGLKQAPREMAFNHLCALSYLSQGDDDNAIKIYTKVLQSQGDHYVANLNIAKLHIKKKDFESALPFLKRCQAPPEQRESTGLILGFCHSALGQHAQAIDCYAQVLELNPHNTTAYIDMASCLIRLKQTAAALELLDTALTLLPESAELLHHKALCLMERGLHVPALEAFRALSATGKETVRQMCSHAELLFRAKKTEEAIAKYQEALAAEPRYQPALIGYGNVLFQLKRFDEAIQHYQAVVQVEPQNSVALSNIASAMLAKRDLEQAWVYGERAYDTNPSVAGAFLYSMAFQCDWKRYDEVLDVLAHDHTYAKSGAFAPVIFSADPQTHLGYSQAAARQIKPTGILGPIGHNPRHDKIRIGYYSCDFFNHATAMLIEGMVQAHDRAKFEVHAFSLDVRRQDNYTERLRGLFDHYHEISHYSDRAVAHLSRTLEIDIAIDLKGYTEGSRPAIFAEGAAPLQINFLGFPGTMGASFIDYIVADQVLITPKNRAFFSEKVIYMPHCYQPNHNGRPRPDTGQARPAELPAGQFVFCSFNNVYKVSPAQFKLWMRILRQAPNSVFWMLKSTARAQGNLWRYAAEEGVDAQRLVFAEFLPEADHLTRLSHADLFLDSFPCNAHTTASDALWAGVPLITRSGETFASRVAGSILRTAGMDDLVVTTDQDYETLALRIYSDPDLLGELKRRVVKGIAQGPLYDTALFTRQFEQALETIQHNHRAGLPPSDVH